MHRCKHTILCHSVLNAHSQTFLKYCHEPNAFLPFLRGAFRWIGLWKNIGWWEIEKWKFPLSGSRGCLSQAVIATLISFLVSDLLLVETALKHLNNIRTHQEHLVKRSSSDKQTISVRGILERQKLFLSTGGDRAVSSQLKPRMFSAKP